MVQKQEYKKRLDRSNRLQRIQSSISRAIGVIPKVVKPHRKRKARKSLCYFLKTYFPAAFPLPFSPDHLSVIEKIERSVLDGGLFALALPRGAGKTTILLRAILWAALNGFHRFVFLVAEKQRCQEPFMGI